jgi:hypothetical protein
MSRIQCFDTEVFGRSALRISNGTFEVVVSTGFGPRILAYRAVAGENALGLLPPERFAQPVGSAVWHPYGGHRLWIAPEHPVRTYAADNEAVVVVRHEDGVELVQPAEVESGIVKSMRIAFASASVSSFAADPSAILVHHRLEHRGKVAVDCAPWALTVMAEGGEALFPAPAYAPHPEGLLPARPLVLWPYTALSDARFRFERHLWRLRHDTQAKDPQKIGFYNEAGWAAYATPSQLFIKRYPVLARAHTDMGCNTETFTNAAMLEVESLGPLVHLEPGGVATHVESLALFPGCVVPSAFEQGGEVSNDRDASAARLLAEALTKTSVPSPLL